MGSQILFLSESARTVAPNELPEKRLDELPLLVQQGQTSLQGLQSTAPWDLTCQVLNVPAVLVIPLTLPASHTFHRKRLVMRCEM